MIWVFGLVAPLLVFVALFDFRKRAKRRARAPVQVQSEPLEGAHQLGPLEAPEAVPGNMPVIEDTRSAFDVLRGAVEADNADLSTPLCVALSSLITVGRSLDVHLNFKQQFNMLDVKLRDFQVVVDVSTTEAAATATAAVDMNLQKLLRAMAVVTLRIWDAAATSIRGVTSGRSEEPVQESGEAKNLLELLSTMLQIFEFDDDIGVNERLTRIRQRLNCSDSNDGVNSRALASIVNNNSNTNYIFGDGPVTNNNWAINIIRIVKEQENAIREITLLLGDRFVSEAADDAQPSTAGCMHGTRTRILSKFVEWAIGDPMAIYWLAGKRANVKLRIFAAFAPLAAFPRPPFPLHSAKSPLHEVAFQSL